MARAPRSFPKTPGDPHDAAFTAEGIFGQFVYVNPKEQIVAAIWSAWRSSWDVPGEIDTYALLGAAVEALRG